MAGGELVVSVRVASWCAHGFGRAGLGPKKEKLEYLLLTGEEFSMINCWGKRIFENSRIEHEEEEEDD